MKLQINKYCNNVASDTISKYNQLKLEIDNKNKFNQNITNIHLADMFTTGLKEFNEINEKTNSSVVESFLKKKKTIVQYIYSSYIIRKQASRR